MNFIKNPYSKKIINYKGYKIQTYSFGTGEKTVFAFPSFPHSGLLYIWPLSKYDLTKLRVITFDLPGWIGNSENIFRTVPFCLDEFVEIAKHILANANVQKYSVLGYSFGGALATRLASEDKEKIRDVVLVSAVINGNDVQNYREGKLVNLLYKSRFSPLVKYQVQHLYKKYKKSMLAQSFPEKYANLYDGLIRNASPKILLTSIYTLFNTDWTFHLRELKGIKVLVANSPQEPLFIRKQAEHIRKVLDGCESLRLCGNHEDFVLKPDTEVIKEVTTFLIKGAI